MFCIVKMSKANAEEGWESPPSKRKKLPDDEATSDADDDLDIDDDESKKDDDFACDPKYDNFVTPEELNKLREFTVLDEVKSNEDESNEDESDSSDGKSEGLPEEEIEKMLEEDLPEGFRGVPQPKKKPYVTRQKIVLEEKGVNHWEALPLDWMIVRHYSGMLVYMHRTTRVCTLSKPYFLGKGNTRRHDIPISAIPCLAYKRALEEERKQQEIDKKIEEEIRNGTWVKTVEQAEQISSAMTKANHAINGNNTNNNNIGNIPSLCNRSKVEYGKSCPVTGLRIEFKNENHVTKDINDISIAKDKDGIAKDSRTTESDCQEGAKENATCDKDILLHDLTNETKDGVICFSNNEVIQKFDFEESNIKKDDDAILIDDVQDATRDEPKDKNDANTSVSVMDLTNETKDGVICLSNNEVIQKFDFEESNIKKDDDAILIDDVQDATRDEPKDKKDVNTSVSVAGHKTGEDALSEGIDDVEIPKYRRPVVLPGGIVVPAPKVENINTSWKTQHLSHEQVNEYCKKLFKFKVVNIMHFNRWADRRKYTKARKTLQYPTLPDGTKLITIPATPANGQDTGGKPVKRDWVMNMDGRTYLSVFHEYVRRALQKQPVYEFVQLENAATPYQATVYIGGMQYGIGHGSSKRQAKSAAARASIHILIPEVKEDLEKPVNKEPDFSFFDQVGIEDPRISEFCAATCEPSPHAILRTCLLRNFGASDRHIQTEMKKLEFQKIELTMKVGKHSVTVVCKNKKTAKQRASQAILQALHPHVRSWGSLLRLYGSRSVKSCKEKKLEEQQITLLQDKARQNQPNYAVLSKLRNEMLKLRDRDRAVVPIGTLLLEAALPTHSGSNLNNVDL